MHGPSPVPARIAGSWSALSLALLLAGGCVSFTPAAAPLVTGCVGECGGALSVQAIVPGSSSPVGCPNPQCTLQLKVEGGNLCPNESAQVVIKKGAQLLWQKPYTFEQSPFPGIDPAKVGDVDLIAADVVQPNDLISVAATTMSNDNPVACKQEGNFLFSIIVLH